MKKVDHGIAIISSASPASHPTPTTTSVGSLRRQFWERLRRPDVRDSVCTASVHQKTSSTLYSRPPLPIDTAVTDTAHDPPARPSLESPTGAQQHASRPGWCQPDGPRKGSSHRRARRQCGSLGRPRGARAEASAVAGNIAPLFGCLATPATGEKGRRATACPHT